MGTSHLISTYRCITRQHSELSMNERFSNGVLIKKITDDTGVTLILNYHLFQAPQHHHSVYQQVLYLISCLSSILNYE